MQKHPYFDLQLLENEELFEVLHTPVYSRITLHQWPLSCVEKMVDEDGNAWILKSNWVPCQHEGEFYEQTNHPHIIKPIYIQHSHPYQAIVYPYMTGQSLKEMSEKMIGNLRNRYPYFHQVLREVDRPDLPVYLQIDTEKRFRSACDELLNNLHQLVTAGEFTCVDRFQLETLTGILQDNAILEIAMTEIGFVHGDFSADNILIQDEETWFILDWQRPIRGSRLIDEYQFMRSIGEMPSPQAAQIGIFFTIYWFCDCAVRWFPAGIPTYDQQICQLIAEFAEISGY